MPWDRVGKDNPMVDIDSFAALDLRVGRIVAAETFPEARKPAYRLSIDLGPLGIKTSSAQITALYALDDLPGRLVIVVANLPPRRIASFVSEVLVLGVPDDEGRVALLTVDRSVAHGVKVY